MDKIGAGIPFADAAAGVCKTRRYPNHTLVRELVPYILFSGVQKSPIKKGTERLSDEHCVLTVNFQVRNANP